MKEIKFPQYPYTSITGTTYTPYLLDGRWFVVPGLQVSFLHFVYLCKIPEDEAILLKLTHSG